MTAARAGIPALHARLAARRAGPFDGRPALELFQDPRQGDPRPVLLDSLFSRLIVGPLVSAALFSEGPLRELVSQAYGPPDGPSRHLRGPSFHCFCFETENFLILCEAEDGRPRPPGRRDAVIWSALPKPDSGLSIQTSAYDGRAVAPHASALFNETAGFFEAFALGIGSLRPRVMAALLQELPALLAAVEAADLEEATPAPFRHPASPPRL